MQFLQIFTELDPTWTISSIPCVVWSNYGYFFLVLRKNAQQQMNVPETHSIGFYMVMILIWPLPRFRIAKWIRRGLSKA